MADPQHSTEPEETQPQIKKCSKCQGEKSLGAFSYDKSTHDGRCSWCKTCWAFWHKENYQPYPKVKKECPTHKGCTVCKDVFPLEEFTPDKRLPYGRCYDCKKCRALKKKTRRAANIEHVRAIELAGERAWRNANRETYRAKAKKHRARVLNAPISDLTAPQWLAIKVLYQWRCVYCNKKVVALTQDHITPLSKGGNHTMENVVPACQSCNSKKHTGPALIPIQPMLSLKDLA